MSRMDDYQQKFIGEDLLQYCRIVDMDANGSMSVKPENLDKVFDGIDSLKFQENTPSAVIALTGPTEKAKFILMNFLFDTLEGMGEKMQQQTSAIEGFDWSHRAGNSAFIQRFLNIMEAGSDQDETNSEGIFLWPEPFLVKSHDGKQLAIWIMNMCGKEETNSEELEEITALLSSRVMTLECFADNIRLRVLDPYRSIPVPSDASYPEPIHLEKICDTNINALRCKPLSDDAENATEDNIMKNLNVAKGMNKLLKFVVNTIIEETAVMATATSSETNTDGVLALKIGSMKEIITSAVKMSNEHRQQREKCRLIMEQSLENASKQIKEDFPYFLEAWMKTEFSLSSKQEILGLYTFLKKEVVEKFKSTVNTSLWKEFNELVDDRCKIELEEILTNGLKHVDMLTSLTEQQQQLLGYLLPQKLDEVTKDVLKQVENFAGEGKNILILDLCKLAHEKIVNFYKEENKKILENEKSLFVQDVTHLGEVYYDELEKYLTYASYNPPALETLRQNLLERFCEEIKLFFKSSRDSYTLKLQEEIQNVIQKLKFHYDEKVEEMLKKYSYGLDVKTLGKYHTTIATEVTQLLEMEVKSKLHGQDDHLDNHLKVLQDYIDKYWPTVVETNSRNFRKQNEKVERKFRKRERLETFREQQQHDRLSLPPLVFHLQSSRISMAVMDFEGGAEILKNDSGEDETPPFVVLTPPPQSTFIYGSEAVAYFRSASSSTSDLKIFTWSIADFFLHTNSIWTTTVVINGQNHTITAEFLLAFLLRKLKHAAEDLKGGKFDTAVLTIPFRLSSTQRIKVKHAAKIAGFSESYLINEASAAAFNFVLGDIRSEGEVLVISENLDCVDIFLYTFTMHDKKVKMIAHSDNYNNDGNKKASSITKASNNYMKDILLRNRLLFEQNTDHVETDRAVKDVRDTCKDVLHLAASELHCAKIEPNECFSICENMEKWEKILETVVRDFGNKAVVIHEENAVLQGAVALSMNPNVMANYLCDKLAYGVLRWANGEHHSTNIIGKLDSLPVKCKTQATILPQGHGKTLIYQHILGSHRPIGKLSVKDVGSHQNLEPNLEITHEAIVSLKCVMITSNTAGDRCAVADEQIHWKTPNLSNEKLDEFADLLKLLVTPPVFKEDAVLSGARTDLYKRRITL